MCGIAGQFGPEGAADDAARAMIGALTHRGPDGARTEREGAAALAHARLAVIDLEGGWQPLRAAGVTVVGNGEIYNYLELTRDHGLTGELATGSDFEPLLQLYAREGPAAFARLRGMYALCLVGADGRAWLARDPFGIKPLYLLEHSGGLAFASEPRAFVAAGLMAPRLDDEAARELLAFNYVLGARTALAGVRRLAPGEVIEVTGGRVDPSPLAGEGGRRSLTVEGLRSISDCERWWGLIGRRDPSSDPAPQGHLLPQGEKARPLGGGEDPLLARLDAVLEDSVRVHQRSDVPYGLFLSGGIDSAAIATLMARLNTRPVTAFTCGFEAPGAADERAAAEKVARALDLDWRETSFGEADFWRVLPQIAWALDDPTADYASLPTWKLAEAAKGTLTVVLTGEGGDELFGGYGRYRRALRPRWLGGRAAEPRGTDADLLARWREAAEAPLGLTRLQAAQWGDIATWLPNDLLLKLDRCLMAHGLEGRTPFLNPEVAAFALPLPDRFKVRGGYGKWLLRRWLALTCPAAAPWAKKQGFTVPVNAWIAPRAGDIAARIGQVEAVRRVVGETAAARMQNGASAQRWPLLFFALWALIHLEGAEPDAALATLIGDLG